MSMKMFFSMLSNSVSPQPADNALVVWLYGQSNSVGQFGGTQPSYFNSPLSNVDGQGHSVYIWSIVNQQWEILEWGVNNLAQNSLSWGVEVELGYRLCIKHNVNIYIIKIAQNSVPLYSTIDEYDYNPSTSNEMYDRLINNSTPALAAISEPYTPHFGFWQQGERDSRFLDFANAYNSNLQLFINSWRTDLSIVNTKFICGQVNSNLDTGTYVYLSTVRQAQQDVCGVAGANKISETELIDQSPYQLSGDGLHYTGQGQIDIANAIINTFDL